MGLIFIAVGMSIDFALLGTHPWLVLGLVLGYQTVKGVGPYEARERVNRFRRQNVSSLEAILPHWQDEERRVQMAVSAREQLEAQMELDRLQLALPASHGWHGEDMSDRESWPESA